MCEAIAGCQQTLGQHPGAGEQRGVGHLAQARRRAAAGTGNGVGRESTRPRMRVKSRFRTGSGAVTFTGPLKLSRSAAGGGWRRPRHRSRSSSSTAIRSPTARRAPAGTAAASSSSAPPSGLSTSPNLGCTTRIPAVAGRVGGGFPFLSHGGKEVQLRGSAVGCSRSGPRLPGCHRCRWRRRRPAHWGGVRVRASACSGGRFP